jgi:putative aminopeptidase FrvX
MMDILATSTKKDNSLTNKEDKCLENVNGEVVDTATGEVVEKNDSNKDTTTTENTKTTEEHKEVETTSSTKKEEKKETPEEEENRRREEVFNLGLEHLDTKLMYEMMAVPTCSDYEYRMVTYLILWARKHGIQHHFDDYGNLYFVKGKPTEGNLYPCVTAHLDTVQTKAKAYVLTGAELTLKTRKNTKNEYEVYIDSMGTGSDDKNAILIALHLFEKFDVLKGAFYLGEEIGCKGSSAMDVNFFDDVSYVIGFDSPEKNRAAWRLLGTVKMFTKDFYINYMKEICDKHGLTKFYSESVTDEAYITKNTGLVTMNFGNAGYLAHSQSEYFNVNELDDVIAMAYELVDSIPTNVQHLVGNVVYTTDTITGKTIKKIETDDSDIEYLESLGDNSKYSYYGNQYYSDSKYNYGSSKNETNYNSTSASTSTTTSYDSNKEEYNEETLQYIVDMYDQRLLDIKNDVNKKCKELNIDFKEFESIFEKEVKF